MNEEEMKMTIWLQQKTIEANNATIELLQRRVTELESDEEPLLKCKEERIAFLEEWLKDKDKEIERLRLQVQTNEFNRLFVFGKVGMGKA